MSALIEKIADLRRHMRLSAQLQDWDSVVALDQACLPLFENLRQKTTGSDTPHTGLSQHASLIRQILADEAEIMRLASPRLDALQALLDPDHLYGG